MEMDNEDMINLGKIELLLYMATESLNEIYNCRIGGVYGSNILTKGEWGYLEKISRELDRLYHKVIEARDRVCPS